MITGHQFSKKPRNIYGILKIDWKGEKKYLQYCVRRHPFADKTKHLANRILRHSHILWEERCHGSELEGRWGKGLNGFLEGREDASVGLGLSSNRWISHLGSSPALDRCRSSFVNLQWAWNSSKAQAQLGYGEEWKRKSRVKFWYLYATVISTELQ